MTRTNNDIMMDELTIRLILGIAFALATIKNLLIGNIFFENERVLSKKMKHYKLMLSVIGLCGATDVLCMTYLMVFPTKDIMQITLLIIIVVGSLWVAHTVKYKTIYKLNERD